MDPDPKPVVKVETRCLACDVHTYLVHHRAFPELQVEGLSAETAALHLVNRLSAALDSAKGPSDREAVQAALDEARAYLDQAGRLRTVSGGNQPQAPREAPSSASGSQPRSGEVIDVHPLETPVENVRVATLVKTGLLEVRQLTLPKGREVPSHHAPGQITVHCLEGRVTFTADGVPHDLKAGQMLFLEAGAPHSLVGLEDSTLLVTKLAPVSSVTLAPPK